LEPGQEQLSLVRVAQLAVLGSRALAVRPTERALRALVQVQVLALRVLVEPQALVSKALEAQPQARVLQELVQTATPAGSRALDKVLVLASMAQAVLQARGSPA
jgi:hypothetical protein